MPLSLWTRSARLRRTIAISSVVLAAGGLVLYRAPAAAEAAADGPPPQAHEPIIANGKSSVAFAGPGAHGIFALSHTKVLAGQSTPLFAEVRLFADALAVTGGALGAFGAGILSSLSPAAAGAVLLAAAFAERTNRVRSRTARAVHVLMALVAGALGGSLSTAYFTASLPVFAVAIVVCGVLAALPLLVEADDPVAHALDQAAAAAREPARSALASGAELRRSAEEILLDRPTQTRVKSTWQVLLRLAEARIRLERSRPEVVVRFAEGAAESAPRSAAESVLGMLDQRIAEHVSVLSRAYTAVDTAAAAALGLDDAALKNVEQVGDSLDDVSRALVEVRGEDAVS